MTTLHDFTVTTIDGEERSLGDLRGKVVLVVNVASRCGNTRQYEGLEAMARELRGRGFEILGFPSNDFGAQEPGSDAEIKAFCTSRYGVSFPMFAKNAVRGKAKAPLYAWLTSPGPHGGALKWNFEKFVVGKDGTLRARFGTKVQPDAPELRAAIEQALAE